MYLIETLERRVLLSGEPTSAVVLAPRSFGQDIDASIPDREVGSTFASGAILPAQTTAFAQPGILHSQADFDRMRQKVDAGAEPWLTGWNALISDGYSQAGWTPRPLATVIRGGTGQNFAQMVIDMQRAYQTAVRWKVSGDPLYADQAVRILNAWSSTHTTLTGNADRFLASGLYGFGWAAAADIMRGYSGWAAADVTAFQNYLLSIYYPMQHDFLVNHNGAAITNYWANWDLANIEGMMAVGIFADRQDIYDEAISYLFTGRGNGALDKAFYYLHPGNLMQWQESGRDQGHTTLGMGLFGHIAQMAWNQGLDLFSYNNHQFLAAAEHIAKYNLGLEVPFQTYNWGTGQSGTWQQHSAVSDAARGHGRLVYELISNHYVQRLGMAAPYSTQRVLDLRPEWRGGGDEFGFGTLTYALDGFSAPQAPRGLTAAEKGAGNIQLDFFGGANVTRYNLYRSTTIDGNYALAAAGITDLLSYTDRNLPAGLYYYKVTGVSGSTETAASNIVSATSTSQLHTQLPFDENGGTTANDSTGNGHAGVLVNGAFWTSGKTGIAIGLDGTNDYISLPDGIVADVDDFTISAWVQLASAATWSRIFDFGDDRGRWMMLTPRNGNGVVEFATSTVYGYNKQWVVGNAPLPTGQWVHVAVTLADSVGTPYVNGVAVGSNSNMDFPPSQIRSTPRNWIGRSQFSSDPYLNGKVDDFRIYHGALEPADLYALATGNPAPAPPAAPASLTAIAVPDNTINLSWQAVAGATTYTLRRSTTSGGPYTTLATLHGGTTFSDINRTAGVTYCYVVSGYNNGGDGPDSPQAAATALPPMPSAPTNLVATSSSSTTVSLTWNASPNAATYSVKRALATGGPYVAVAGGLTTTSYIDTGRTAGTTYYYVVTALNAASESGTSNVDSATPSDLIAHLRFDEGAGTTAADSGSNGWNATLVSGPLWSTGRLGNAVVLDGVDDHVTLPTGVINGVTSFTIATWVRLTSLDTWSRIFDFGTGTSATMFLTPQAGGSNLPRFAITTSGGAGEQRIDSNTAIATGAWTHVAVTLSGNTGILYLNGVAVGSNNAMTLTPASLGSTTQNYLGKSQYPDPALNGSLDDFRIYARSLSASEVQALAAPLPAWLASGSSASWEPQTRVLTITGPATLIADPGPDAPIITASGVNAVLTLNPLDGATRINLGGLSLANGATATLSDAPADRVLIVRADQLSIDPTSTLDLADNDLVIDYASVSPVGIWSGSAYDGITGHVAAGRIFSSAAIGNLKGLGLAESRDALAISGTQTGTFAGQGVDSTAVLMKFTWGGDATLDGKLNIDDYGRIDSHVAQSGSVFGWFFGDFNLDGRINIDDYGIIDGNIDQQNETPLDKLYRLG